MGIMPGAPAGLHMLLPNVHVLDSAWVLIAWWEAAGHHARCAGMHMLLSRVPAYDSAWVLECFIIIKLPDQAIASWVLECLLGR
jgi:hypothetical protein